MDPIIVSLRGEYSAARQRELQAQLQRARTYPSVIVDTTEVAYADDDCLREFFRLRHARASAGLSPARFVLDERRFGRLFRFLGLHDVLCVVDAGDAFRPLRRLRIAS
jgi:anti-anti-sigma regulatory factor